MYKLPAHLFSPALQSLLRPPGLVQLQLPAGSGRLQDAQVVGVDVPDGDQLIPQHKLQQRSVGAPQEAGAVTMRAAAVALQAHMLEAAATMSEGTAAPTSRLERLTDACRSLRMHFRERWGLLVRDAYAAACQQARSSQHRAAGEGGGGGVGGSSSSSRLRLLTTALALVRDDLLKGDDARHGGMGSGGGRSGERATHLLVGFVEEESSPGEEQQWQQQQQQPDAEAACVGRRLWPGVASMVGHAAAAGLVSVSCVFHPVC